MTEAIPELFNQLAQRVVRRYQANARKTMFDVYEVNRDFTRLEAENLEFMYQNRVEILSILNDPDFRIKLASLFVKSSLEFTYNNNQYIHLDGTEQQRLLSLYQAYLQGMATVLLESENFSGFESNFQALVKGHFTNLRRNISRFFDHETGWQVKENIILKQVVCSEYSPGFQLGLLGLSTTDLLEPVLDLGCGKHGTLVNHLRASGMNAIGVDRLVDEMPGLRQADWFDVNFSPKSWGSILSHMAFSNHFLFHHRYKHGKAGQYARLYMQILESLKPGGSFIYTPGLPFIEQYLPENEYSINRQAIKGNRIAGDQADESVQVVRVTRLT